MMRRPFELGGRHVLAILAGFFLTVMAANVVFLAYALRTFPGQQVEKSYLQGLRYNDWLAERARQRALGWTATIDAGSLAAGGGEIVLTFADARGRPVLGLEVTGELRRPATAGDDRALVFSRDGAGRYRAALGGVEPGVWDLSATAVSPDGAQFMLTKRLIAP